MTKDDRPTARVTLTRGELLHLKSFAESVDAEDVIWWDRLTNKLERALARVEGRLPRVYRTPLAKWNPDLLRAQCRACGWEGKVTKTQPCPGCGQKMNPFLFDGRRPVP